MSRTGFHRGKACEPARLDMSLLPNMPGILCIRASAARASGRAFVRGDDGTKKPSTHSRVMESKASSKSPAEPRRSSTAGGAFSWEGVAAAGQDVKGLSCASAKNVLEVFWPARCSAACWALSGCRMNTRAAVSPQLPAARDTTAPPGNWRVFLCGASDKETRARRLIRIRPADERWETLNFRSERY